MIYRTILLYVVVQSAVTVFASPTANQHGESFVSPFYRPTPASKTRGIPEVGKLPRTATGSKKLPTTSQSLAKPNSGNNHLSHSGRNQNKIVPQLQRPRYNHLYLDDSYQRPKTQMSNEERAEKVNSDLEKMIQFITLLGQVDRYLSSRAKSIVSTLGRAMENNPDDYRHNDQDMSTYD